MEHSTNIMPAAATNVPAVLPASDPSGRLVARPREHLPESLIASALDAGRDVRPGRASRRDGWTPDRIRIFLDAIAEGANVDAAARAAGMGRTSAYNLRHRAAGRAFDAAWTAAGQLAHRRAAGEPTSRVLHGCVEPIMRDGKQWGERHYFDNPRAMAALTRLDKKVVADGPEDRLARLVAEEFDHFVNLVCAGGDGADEFIASRIEAGRDGTAGR